MVQTCIIGRYVWSLAAMSGLMSVTNLQPLITTFFADTVANASNSSVLLMAASFPAGLLVCQLVPAHFYSRLDHRGRRRLCLCLQFVSFCAALGLSIGFSGRADTHLAVAFKVALVFGTSFGLGVAYYIPLHAASVQLAADSAGVLSPS